VPSSLDIAKQVLAANEAVLYGAFGAVAASVSFPPRGFLNEFFMRGYDPCDQDGRMSPWRPFTVSDEEYRELKAWWLAGHAGAVEDDLGAKCWNDWLQGVIHGTT
jgi:hypothetical protein